MKRLKLTLLENQREADVLETGSTSYTEPIETNVGKGSGSHVLFRKTRCPLVAVWLCQPNSRRSPTYIAFPGRSLGTRHRNEQKLSNLRREQYERSKNWGGGGAVTGW